MSESQITKFGLDKHYLIKESDFYPCDIIEIKILAITEKCYKVEYVLPKVIRWEEMEYFDNKYHAIETFHVL